MKISTLFILISLFIFGCASTDKVAQKNKAQLHLQLGTSHYLNGKFPQALRELMEAERLDPDDAIIQNNLGLAFMVRDKMDDAEKRFKRAIELRKNYTDARNNLGRLYIDVGLYSKAVAELEIAASDLTYEQPEKSWSNLGQAYFLAKQYPKAKLALQNSLNDRRESCFTMNFYGRTLFELQNFKEAADSFDKAIQYCEKNNFDEPYFYSALSFYKLGQVEKSRARLNEMVDLYPSSRYAKQAHEMLETLK